MKGAIDLVGPTQRQLSAWGHTSLSVCREWLVEGRDQAVAAMRRAGPQGVIAAGFRRSYGDVGLNTDGDVLNLTPMATIHSFDEDTGVLQCDAGTSFRALMNTCLASGWQPAVCPGTAFVSMGGAVANDVHGKNQHGAGNFGDYVDWLEMLMPDATIRRITRESDPELFTATIGGIGLTGVILSLQVRLARVASNAMELREVRVPNLDRFFELLESTQTDYPYVVGWIDALSKGRNMGRGVLEVARPALEGVPEPHTLELDVPFRFPAWVLNRHTVRAFNACYFQRVPLMGRSRRIHTNRFLYPLDAIHNWNRMYGNPGVYQFQCVVPLSESRRAIIELMEEAIRSRGASFLAVIKTMGRAGIGMLSFPIPGFTLAIDFPRRPGTMELITRLHDIVLDFGGRIYLAKDACLTADRFRAMYPELPRFKAVLKQVDPTGILQSDMSRRLRLHAN